MSAGQRFYVNARAIIERLHEPSLGEA